MNRGGKAATQGQFIQPITLGEALRRERAKTLIEVMDVLNVMETDIRQKGLQASTEPHLSCDVWSKLSMIKQVQKMIGEI